jgi:rhodanese-related sulfurtransferase
MTGTARITAAEAAAALVSSDPPIVVDVRAPNELAKGRIEGSLNLPLNRLGERLDELPANRRVLVHCAGGYRSSIAAGLMQQRGLDVLELAGGMAAWEAAGQAVAH